MMGKLYMTGKRMARFKILALVFAMVTSSALGAFLIEENSITVTSPDSLKGTYQSSIGNFGVPQYGGTLAGTVVYLKDKPKGCDPFEDRTFRANSGGRPVFALVDRGGLFFFDTSFLFVVCMTFLLEFLLVFQSSLKVL
jgi:hypothetical protein